MSAAWPILGAALALGIAAAPAAGEEVKAAVLRIDSPRDLPISRLDLPPDDLGFAGAALAAEDNQTTGRFLGMEFALETRAAPPEDAAEALDTLKAEGHAGIVVPAK